MSWALGPAGAPVIANPGNSSIHSVLRLPGSPAMLQVLVNDDRVDESDIYRATFSSFSAMIDVLPQPGEVVVEGPGVQYEPVAALVTPLLCGHSSGCLAQVVAYLEPVEDGQILRARRIDGITWDVDVTPLGQLPGAHSIVSDGGTGVWICWANSVDGTIRYQHLDGAGQRLLPVEGELLTFGGEVGGDARIAVDGAGGFFAVWLAALSAGGSVGLRAQRIRADGAHDPGWPAAGVLLRTANGSIGSPFMAPSPTNGIYVAWAEQRVEGGILQPTETRMTRVQPDATIWPAFAGSIAYLPGRVDPDVQSVAPDGMGGVVMAVQVTIGGQPRFVLQRVDPNGARPAGWPVAGIPVSSPAPGTSQLACKVIGQGGGVYAVWQDNVPGAEGGDIMATRRLANGSLPAGWEPEGKLVGGGAVHQYDPFIVNDDTDGALIVWGQGIAGTGFGIEVYGNSVNAAGQLDVSPAPVVRPTRVALALGSRNPSRTGFRFTLDLPEDAQVRAEVVDVAGRRVAELASGRFAAGRRTLEWAGGNGPGLYFVRAQVAGESLSLPVTIAR